MRFTSVHFFQDAPERLARNLGVEVVGVKGDQRAGPVEALGHAGHLLQLPAAEVLHTRAICPARRSLVAGHLRPEDAHLLVERG